MVVVGGAVYLLWSEKGGFESWLRWFLQRPWAGHVTSLTGIVSIKAGSETVWCVNIIAPLSGSQTQLSMGNKHWGVFIVAGQSLGSERFKSSPGDANRQAV